MITLLAGIVIFGFVFWVLCETISALAGIVFILIAASLTVKLAKEIFK